jgi:hypothetical protein
MTAHGSSSESGFEQEHRAKAKRRNAAPLQPGLQVVATLLALRVGYRIAKTAGKRPAKDTAQKCSTCPACCCNSLLTYIAPCAHPSAVGRLFAEPKVTPIYGEQQDSCHVDEVSCADACSECFLLTLADEELHMIMLDLLLQCT